MKITKPVLAALLLFGSMLMGCEPAEKENNSPNKKVESPIPNIQNPQPGVEYAAPEVSANKEQLARKKRSEGFCEAFLVPINANLPVLPDSSNTTLRPAKAVARRAIALAWLGLWSEAPDDPTVEGFYHEYGVSNLLTAKERIQTGTNPPTQQQLIDANWRYESLFVLMWALGYVEDLPFPEKTCDLEPTLGPIFSMDRGTFEENAQLRSKKEILDQADLIYRLHWACVDARIKGEPVPARMDPSVVLERHYALNWLISYLNQPWDEVSTDT